MMKKAYETPAIEEVLFDTENIMEGSGWNSETGDGGIEYGGEF